MKLGLCEKCGRPTDACYEIRNNRVFLVKFCRDCGRTASLVTKDARKWRWKREIAGYQEPVASGCSMDCGSCDHQAHTSPTTVAVDVTNLCNQRCPICLAYVDAMGFSYLPPIEYFEKVYKHFLNNDPRPNLCFFGGEPTMHPDFLDIVALARSYGYQVQLFTNGIKFADKEYCRKLCSLGIQINFGFDGTRPEIYKTLRGDNSLAVKRKAFENVIECGVNKLAVISTVALGVNDGNMAEILDFIHDYRQHVSVWGFVPLTPCWESENVRLEPTTTECVENVFEKLIPDVEFVSTGMMKFRILSRFFGKQTLGGSHPNCESATLLISDGEQYLPLANYLSVPLSELLGRLRRLDSALVSESAGVPEKGLRRFLFDAKTFVQTLAVLKNTIKLRKIFGGSVLLNGARAVADLMRGKKIDAILKERTCFKNVLTLITIPYEDEGGLEDARLKDCPAVFAYEDVDTGRIRTAAFCSWQTVKDEICRKIQTHYEAQSPQEQVTPRRTASKDVSKFSRS
ncbi:MAG TPA: radical SAM protein [Desulfomonilaceae bacterium]|nr:radical SAM protein [Desulfomonilaceae bacterium]